jgi:hypothetical protein
MKWQTLKDKTVIIKNGRYKVLQIFKRPHGRYCCLVFNRGECVSGNGYFATALPKKHLAVRWGISKATELGIIKGHVYKSSSRNRNFNGASQRMINQGTKSWKQK